MVDELIGHVDPDEDLSESEGKGDGDGEYNYFQTEHTFIYFI